MKDNQNEEDSLTLQLDIRFSSSKKFDPEIVRKITTLVVVNLQEHYSDLLLESETYLKERKSEKFLTSERFLITLL